MRGLPKSNIEAISSGKLFVARSTMLVNFGVLS